MKRRILFCIALIAFGLTAFAQDWIDITEDYIQNPNFDGDINGWVDTFDGAAQNHGYQGASYSNGSVTISKFAEAWRDKNSWTRFLGNASIYQTISNLPTGKFRLEADAIANDQANENNSVSGVLLFMESSSNLATTEMATANGKPKHFSVEMTDYTGIITIGVRTENAKANWLAFDNVRLFHYGTIIAPTNTMFPSPAMR